MKEEEKIAKNLIDLFFITTHLTLKAKSSTYYNATADPITFFFLFFGKVRPISTLRRYIYRYLLKRSDLKKIGFLPYHWSLAKQVQFKHKKYCWLIEYIFFWTHTTQLLKKKTGFFFFVHAWAHSGHWWTIE